jgi:hypothetical protein
MTEPMLPLIDVNLVESVREFARWQKGGELVEREGVLLVAGTTRFPVVSNAALRLDRQIPAERVLSIARDYFDERRRRYTIWVRPEIDDDVDALATASGFLEVSSTPWMVLEAPIPDDGPPEGLSIREAEDEAAIVHARDVNSEAFTALQMPASEVEAIYGVPSRALNPLCRTFVGYEREKPVATAMLLLTHGVAGVYWVGTVEAARGRGYAAAMMRTVSNAGFEGGAQLVTLQASIMGEPVYARLGYRAIGRQKWLLSPKVEK